jgi:two-component system OmpR family response regulator
MVAAMDSAPHILVVDDQRDIREPLGRYLEKHGLRVTLAKSAADAREALKRSAVDLVVLDIMMPGEDGLSLCRHLREAHNMPVILLTAMAEDADRIVGLEVGADDYVVKPFNPRELVARVKAVLRRATTLPKPREEAGGRLRFERWTFDLARREVVAGGVAVPLSTAEFRLLLVLARRPRMVLTRDQLLDLTAGREAQPFDRAIDNQISRLRKKLEADPKNPTLIKTVWGGGYVFAAEVVEE